MPKRPRSSVSRRLARVERDLAKDKPEVKTLDVVTGTPSAPQSFNPILSQGINTGTGAAPVYSNYDLTRGFLQGLQNTGGNIDGNYCKLTSMDLRIYLRNAGGTGFPQNSIRLMIVRVPNASTLTPAEIQSQVLEYGDPATYGQLCLVSPFKRNTTINGGYDVMYDKVHILNSPLNTTPHTGVTKSAKYVHFKKKWAKGLTLRFSGVAASLALEQNRLYLFAMDSLQNNPAVDAVSISFINRLRYSDE